MGGLNLQDANLEFRAKQVTVLNSEFCTRYSDYTLHWTDKDSMRQVRSLTSEYNILSPGVLSFPKAPRKCVFRQ